MKLLTKSVSIFATLVGVAALTSAPVKAESTFSGSATFSTPSGYTQSLSGEMTTKHGTITGVEDGGTPPALLSPSVEAEFQDVAAGTPETPGTSGKLTLNAQIDYTEATSIERAVAEELDGITIDSITNLDRFNSIVQSAGGTDGLE